MQIKGRVTQLSPGSRQLDLNTNQPEAMMISSTVNNTSQRKEAMMNAVAEALSFPESVMSNDENHQSGNLGSPPLAPNENSLSHTPQGTGGMLLKTSTNTDQRGKFAAGPSKGTSLRGHDPRLPAVKSTSVFDRLYKSHTISSRSHAKASKAMITPSARSKVRVPSSVDVDRDLQIFGRLSVGDTVSSSQKRIRRGANNTPHKIKYSIGAASFASPPPTNPKRSPTYYQTPHTASGFGSGSRTRLTRYEFSPRMKPLTKLYFISKFHPGVGLEPVEPLSLGYTFFQAFCEYESGGMDSEQIAKEIIVALFKKDFPSGRHWALHEPELGAKIKDGGTAGGGTAYPVSMSATYDWEDAYRVAHGHGVVRFKRAQKEIRVENYTYDLTGDP